jgi:hypothetical protein
MEVTKKKGGQKDNKNASKYNDRIVVEVCDMVADGMNIKKALASNEEYPTFTTWCVWKRENEFVSNLYVNSIQDKSESVDDQIDEIMQELKDKLIEASVANVLIQTLKWKASKYYPKMFGDNTRIDHTTDGKSLNTPLMNLDPLKVKE